MSKLSRTAIPLAALLIASSVASAQRSCHAELRTLSDPGAREQLAAIQALPAGAADVMGSTVVCADSTTGRQYRGVWVGLTDGLLRMQYNGGVPDVRQNDGAWTGLGLNMFARMGVSLNKGRMHAVLAPEAWYAENRIFAFYPNTAAGRNGFASNWYDAPYSIDLPSRWGARSVQSVNLGQSAAWATLGSADVGISTAAVSWGPGVRSHLLLGPDAPGIPRVFVQTNHPVTTSIGSWSGTAFMGTLTESPFFDQVSSNDLRTLTAWNLAWSPSANSPTVIGIEHLGMRTGSPFGRSDQKLTGPTDQLNGLYARMSGPGDGMRAYMEIARSGALPSFRRFFEIPYQGIAYMVGVQKETHVQNGTLLFTGELSNLEQPIEIRGQQTQDFYTSSDIAQGWTQRGQLLGSGPGPGGQSQWLSVDWITRARTIGVFIERVRWNEDAFTRQYTPFLFREDVTLHAGLRGETTWDGRAVRVELSGGKRLNYLFQNGTGIPGLYTTDVTVSELKLSITPFAVRRGTR
jgi:hypothetical protein